MTIEVNTTGTHSIVSLGGRIDVNSAPLLQNELLALYQSQDRVLLDFEKVDYLSSAGLRSLLIGHKTAMSKNAELILVNVTPLVMSILEMSGFSSILKINPRVL